MEIFSKITVFTAKILLVSSLLMVGFIKDSVAAGGIVRDEEIEATLDIYAEPLLEAAGIPPSSVEIILIDQDELNAFVAGGMNIFIYTGLIMETETPEALMGIMAHEIGHIAGGHLVRTHQVMENASRQAMVTSILGIVAAAAAGRGDAGMAIIAGGQGYAQGSILRHSRSQEAAADTAAMLYMDRAGVSTRGMYNFLRILEDQDLLPETEQQAYARTHPVTRERVMEVAAHIETSPYSDTKLPDSYYELHERMRAKLMGYSRPMAALREFSGDDSIAAQYGLAIANYRMGSIRTALRIIDELIVREPDNPYFYELKGQILFEDSRIEESIEPYRMAVSFLPRSGLLNLGLGHALVEMNDDEYLEEAIDVLKIAAADETQMPLIHGLLAAAFGRLGDEAGARLHLAEEALLQQDYAMATARADQALNLFEKGTRGYQHAEDIKMAAENLME